jgi:predicted nuclease of predicted toxin-antitoxin system
VAFSLRHAGFDALHVREISMGDAEDEAILVRAAQDGRIVISADIDFATLLALRQDSKPSVVLFREGVSHRPAKQAGYLLAKLSCNRS